MSQEETAGSNLGKGSSAGWSADLGARLGGLTSHPALTCDLVRATAPHPKSRRPFSTPASHAFLKEPPGLV